MRTLALMLSHLSIGLLLAGCPTGEHEGELGPGKKAIVETPGERPGRITGLKAVIKNGGVELTWNADAKAKRYVVYRQQVALSPALAPLFNHGVRRFHPNTAVGDILGFADSNVYLDTQELSGVRLTYQIAGTNDIGLGEASEPVFVEIEAIDPFKGWTKAGALQDPRAFPGMVTDAPFTGISTATLFPESAAYADCVTEGIAIRSIRPAEGTVLNDGMQSFEVTFAVNSTSTSDSFGFYLVQRSFTTRLSEDDTFLYAELRPISGGCYEHTMRVTTDLSAFTGDAFSLHVLTTVGWERTEKRVHYRRAGAPYVGITHVNMPAGALLTGEPLEVEISWWNLDAHPVSLYMYDNWSFYGIRYDEKHLVLNASGSQTMLFNYPQPCPSDGALDKLYFGLDAWRSGEGYAYYVAPTTSSLIVVPWNVQRSIPADRVENSNLYFNVESCTGSPQWVTASTDSGAHVKYKYSATTAESVTGSTAAGLGTFSLKMTDATQFPPGRHDLLLRVTDATGITYAAAVSVDVFRVWPETLFPELPIGGQTYSVSFTAEGATPPWLSLDLWSDTDPSFSLSAFAPWTGNRFETGIYLRHCGIYRFFIVHSSGSYWWNGDKIQDFVSQSSSVPSLYTDYEVDFRPNRPQAEMAVNNACSENREWEVVGAPNWLIFESLTGRAGADPVRMYADIGSDDYASSDVTLKSTQDEREFSFRVYKSSQVIWWE